MRDDLLEGLVDRHEFARQLGIDPKTAFNWHQRGYGPRRRYLGGKVFYLQAEIDAFVRDLRSTSVVA
jgi:hypothetical protein